MRIKYGVSCKTVVVGMMVVALLAIAVAPAVANTIKTEGFLADDFMSKLNAWVWNVVLPLSFTGGIAFLIYSLLKGREVGGRAATVVAIAFIVGGGVPWVSSQLGINLAWGAERPSVVRMVDVPPSRFWQE